MFGFGPPETEDLQEPRMRGLEASYALERLKRKISKEIDKARLHHGHQVSSIILDNLDNQQRHWVFEELNGKLFEREASHVQYKLIWDRDMDGLYVIESYETNGHACMLDSQ